MLPPMNTTEVAAALHGLARLARLDREGLAYFDASAGGLLKSFWVAVLLLPLYLLHLFIDVVFLDVGSVVHPLRYVAVELIAYVIDWVTFPLLILSMTHILMRSPERLFGFLVPVNWVQLPIGLIVLPLGMLARLDLLPHTLSSTLGLIVVGGSLLITTALARFCLDLPWWTAVGVTALGFFISIFVNGLAFSMTGGA